MLYFNFFIVYFYIIIKICGVIMDIHWEKYHSIMLTEFIKKKKKKKQYHILLHLINKTI
jgi:hypothetical protein